MFFLAFIVLFPRSQPTLPTILPSVALRALSLLGSTYLDVGLKLPDYLTLLRLAVASQQLLHL